LAILLAGVLFVPVSTYISLFVGGGISMAATYLIVILLNEITRMSGKRLTKQELFITYTTIGAVAGTVPFYFWLIYRVFLVNTPIAQTFLLGGIPLVKMVPSWFAPPPASPSYSLRTLFHVEWAVPVFIYTLMALLSFIADISLAMIFSISFIEVENLRFPLADIDSSLITTLSEKEETRMRFFILSLVPGLIYGFLLYASPLFGPQFVPLLWADLTQFTENYLPGALMGIATDPGSYLLGLLLPLSVSGTMLAGSVSIWIIGNVVFYKFYPNVFPQWPKEYSYGMNLATCGQRSYLRIWISPQIGFGLGLAIMIALKVGRRLFRTLASLKKSPALKESGYPSNLLLIAIYLLSTGGSVGLFRWLVPDYPLWLATVTSIGLSFLVSLIVARTLAEVGVSISMPWPWQAFTFFSPYEGLIGWIFQPTILMGTCAYTVQTTKVAYLTETKPIDYYRALIIAFALNAFFGFLSLDFFWRLAPIPSSMYPYTMSYFPIYMQTDWLMVTRQVRMYPMSIIASTGISALLFALGEVLTKFNVAFSAVALVSGFFTWPTTALGVFIGSILSVVIGRFLGKERWQGMRGNVIAGFLAGLGVSLGFAISIALISKSTWVWPW